jgi:hypothetical protein
MSSHETESMNEDLQKWINETKNEVNRAIKAKGSNIKKPAGMCEICGEKNAKSVCLKCEKSVCGSCYFHLISVCKKCVPKETAAKWEGKVPDWEEVLGVEWVD